MPLLNLNTRCLALFVLVLLQPFTSISFAEPPQDEIVISPSIDLDLLESIGITPHEDAAHGWSVPSEGTPIAQLRHRDSVLIEQKNWPRIFGTSPLSGWMILAHEAPVPTEWHGELADAGIECRSFLPPQSFHCNLNGHQLTELAELEVISMVRFDPIDRVHKLVAPALTGEWDAILHQPGRGVFNIVLTSDEMPDFSDAPADSIEVLSHSGRFVSIDATTLGIAHIATLGAVEWIEPTFDKILMNDIARVLTNASWVESSSNMQSLNSSWIGLNGSGITVTVADTGLDNGVNNSNMHPDFRDHITGIVSYSMEPGYHNFCGGSSNDGAEDTDGHGTHVSGSVLGDGTNSGGAIIGSATEANLLFQATDIWCNALGKSVLVGIPSNISHMFDDAVANGSRVHTNSWGSDAEGEYTTNSMQADIGARIHRNLTILFAAGNEGIDSNSDGEVDDNSLGAPASGKNVLTVGASENNRTTLPTPTCSGSGCSTPFLWGWSMCESGTVVCYPVAPISSDPAAGDPQGMAAFSSRGPTDDSRLKPEITAPGTYILSTKSRSTTSTGWGAYNSSYVYMGGTSMATPLTAGIAALLLQHLMENANNSNPTSALVKGIFSAAGDDMTGQYSSSINGAGEPAPNNHEGWGLVNLTRMMNTSYIEGEGVSTGEERSFRFTVPASTPDLRVIISWTDPESTTSASVNLVNDLDLNLKKPDGTWINISNDRDNLVGKILSNPASGIWEVHVTGTSVPVGPQDFSIVLSRAFTMVNISADLDADGFIDIIDDCSSVFGLSTVDRTGCPDSDGDGRSNPDSSWTVGNGADAFPSDSTQWADSDFDGYGDNSLGTDSDECISVAGPSFRDRQGCLDGDSDGWSDSDSGWTTVDGADSCESIIGTSNQDRNGCLDGDGDGWSDGDLSWTIAQGADAFPSDVTQWVDGDSDSYGDNQTGNNPDGCPSVFGNSTNPVLGCLDQDGDSWADTNDVLPNDASQWNDSDSDGYGDNSSGTEADDCPMVPGSSFQNGTFGCPDGDTDGWSDGEDEFPSEPTQNADSDGDGFGDNLSGVNGDNCPTIGGNSSVDRQGCIDSDGDGRSDPDSLWTEVDGADSAPNESTQWADADGDGYGDNIGGFQGDECPAVAGNSSIDRYGCVDGDGDGYSDANDDFPANASEWLDSDGDNIGDNSDLCPNEDSTNWDADQDGCIDDNDGDDVGNNVDLCPLENATGWDQDNDGCIDDSDSDGVKDPDDAFPNDENETADSDSDGVGDNADVFPSDPSQSEDADSDGYGDAPTGTNPDACPTEAGNSSVGALGCIDTDGDGVRDSDDDLPLDSNHTSDIDSDGIGDSADACPNNFGTSVVDRLGCTDSDGDGRSDPNATWLVGDGADAFPGDDSQWTDSDGDGYGDNTSGNTPDSCLTTLGTSFQDKFGCPDADSDGWSDDYDRFVDDSSQWNDSDGDGYGDNQNGFSPDSCPTLAGNSTEDIFGCNDSDGDDWSDEGDFLSSDSTQQQDSDGDGYGDNSAGTNGDACPQTFGTSSRADIRGCVDGDGDGYSDTIDRFSQEPTQWNDSDDDGYGDNNALGAANPDYWPSDPDKNIAEIEMDCTPNVLTKNLTEAGEFKIICVLTNPSEVAFTVLVEWVVPNGISAPNPVQTIYIGATGGDTAMSTITFTGTITSTEAGEFDTTISARDSGSDKFAAIESSTYVLVDPEAIETDVMTEYGLPIAIGTVSLITVGLLTLGFGRRGKKRAKSEARLERQMANNTPNSYQAMMSPRGAPIRPGRTTSPLPPPPSNQSGRPIFSEPGYGAVAPLEAKGSGHTKKRRGR